MIRRYKVLFLVFSFFLSCFSFAETPHIKLVQEAIETVLGNIVGKSSSRGIGYKGWTLEREAALSSLNGHYNDDVMKAVRTHLETPQAATKFLESEGGGDVVSAGLDQFNRYWRSIFETFVQFESRSPAAVQKMGQVTGGQLVRARVLQFYQEKVLKILKETRSYVSSSLEGSLSLEDILQQVRKLFENPAIVGTPSPESLNVINRSFLKVMDEIRDRIAQLRGIILAGDHVVEGNGLTKKIEELYKLVNQHLKLLNRTIPLQNIADDVLRAHVRFGSIEEQKVALYHLINLYEKKGGLSHDVLQSLLTLNPSPVYQKLCVNALAQRGVFTKNIQMALENEVQKLARLFSDQPEFDVTVQVIINMLLGRSESALRVMIEETSFPAIKRIGAIKTLGQIDSKESLEILVDLYSKAAIEGIGEKHIDQAVVAHLVDALAGKATSDFRTVEEVFKNVIYNTTDHYGRMSAVSGLWKIYAETQNPKQAEVLMDILKSYGDSGSQLEAILGLSRVGYIDDALVAKMKFYLMDGIDNDVRMAAATFIMPKAEIEAMAVLSNILDKNLQVMVETMVKALQQIRKCDVDITTIKNGLWRLTDFQMDDQIRIEALTLLAKEDPKALQALFHLFEESQMSARHKKEIIERALKLSGEDKVAVQVLQKIIRFYQDPRHSFDFFEAFEGPEKQLPIFRRLAPLKENADVLNLLKRMADQSDHYPDLSEFARSLLTFPQ